MNIAAAINHVAGSRARHFEKTIPQAAQFARKPFKPGVYFSDVL